jgi:hypothetical protein
VAGIITLLFDEEAVEFRQDFGFSMHCLIGTGVGIGGLSSQVCEARNSAVVRGRCSNSGFLVSLATAATELPPSSFMTVSHLVSTRRVTSLTTSSLVPVKIL